MCTKYLEVHTLGSHSIVFIVHISLPTLKTVSGGSPNISNDIPHQQKFFSILPYFLLFLSFQPPSISTWIIYIGGLLSLTVASLV